MFCTNYINNLIIKSTSKKEIIMPIPAIITLTALICLIVFGADSFILPSLVLTVLVLLALKKPLEKAAERSGGM